MQFLSTSRLSGQVQELLDNTPLWRRNKNRYRASHLLWRTFRVRLTQLVLPLTTKRPFTKSVKKSILTAKSFLGKRVHESSVT